MATAKTSREMIPTMCDGNKWSTGKPKPVTLVATVVTRKSAVHPLRSRPRSRTEITTSPEPIPIRLSTTCTSVNVASGIPQAMPFSSVFGRRWGLDLPQERVDAARDLGEEVDGVGVAERVGRVDARAGRRAEARGGGGQREHVLAARADIEPVFGEARGLGGDARGAERRAPVLDGVLGEVVGVLEQLVHDLVEELVQRDEARPLHVQCACLACRA